MLVDGHVAAFELGDEVVHGGVVLVARDHDGLHVDPELAEVVDDAERVGVVGDAEVGADLLPFDVAGENADHDVDLVLQALEQFELHVRVESRQDARRVEVVGELAAEFDVQFVLKPFRPAQNFGGLFLQIACVVEACLVHRLFHGLTPFRPTASGVVCFQLICI